ncbi:hypothetical protein N801_18695 [Knoellia aerolata DSM 18566]|uniref:Uncharacterized protein n=1 Tax=Knoellia aerolata DSM 18566 TaxID=1385519 RepID=A0A0A0JQU4_9MICO|nr:hypothetical protein N801_18695 [Knoellia aerolata DSM 18566]
MTISAARSWREDASWGNRLAALGSRRMYPTLSMIISR